MCACVWQDALCNCMHLKRHEFFFFVFSSSLELLLYLS